MYEKLARTQQDRLPADRLAHRLVGPSALTQGLSAMQWTGLWAMPGIRQQIEEDFNVSQFPPIDIGNGAATPATFWGGWVQFVNGGGSTWKSLWPLSTGSGSRTRTGRTSGPQPTASTCRRARALPPQNTHLSEGNAKIALDGLYAYGRANGPFWTGSMGTAITDA